MVLDSVPKVVGVVYAVLASVLVAVLLKTGKFNRKMGYALLVVSSLLGFLIFAPMLPLQFQTVLLGNAKQLMAPLGVVVAMLVVFLVLAFVFGRTFCSYACPIGAVQELVHLLPGRKFKIRTKSLPIGFRLAFLGAFVGLAVGLSVGLLKYVGVPDFFHLDFSTYWAIVFVGLLAVGVIVYRPVCRFLCPYGALLAFPAYVSRLKLTRKDDCIECGKCETVCPTNEAGRHDSGQECYLCHRCVRVCPTQSIHYARRRAQPTVDLSHGKVGEAAVALQHHHEGSKQPEGGG